MLLLLLLELHFIYSCLQVPLQAYEPDPRYFCTEDIADANVTASSDAGPSKAASRAAGNDVIALDCPVS